MAQAPYISRRRVREMRFARNDLTMIRNACLLLWGFVPVARLAALRRRRFRIRDDVFE